MLFLFASIDWPIMDPPDILNNQTRRDKHRGMGGNSGASYWKEAGVGNGDSAIFDSLSTMLPTPCCTPKEKRAQQIVNGFRRTPERARGLGALGVRARGPRSGSVLTAGALGVSSYY